MKERPGGPPGTAILCTIRLVVLNRRELGLLNGNVLCRVFSHLRIFTPTVSLREARWLKTWDLCLAAISPVDESGARELSLSQPVGDIHMSQSLQDLRAAAALRRQQQQQATAPLRSPAASDFDAQCLQSLRSAASSRRSQINRASALREMVSGKNELIHLTHSQGGYQNVDEIEEHGNMKDSRDVPNGIPKNAKRD